MSTNLTPDAAEAAAVPVKEKKTRKPARQVESSNIVPIDQDEPYIQFLPNGQIKMLVERMVKGEPQPMIATVCDNYIRVVGEASLPDGEAYRVFEAQNPFTNKHYHFPLSMSVLGTAEGWARLRSNNIVALRQHYDAFVRYLAGTQLYDLNGINLGRLPHWDIAQKPGWNGDYFMLPNGDIIKPDSLELGRIIPDVRKYRGNDDVTEKGTANSWLENVAPLMKGNASFMLALGVALAAPMLDICKQRGFGVHIWGTSGDGKTTAVTFAESIYGDPATRITSWNKTQNATSRIAVAHNNMCMSLDEMKSANPKTVQETIYDLLNGKSRSRLNQDGSLQEQETWNSTFLSTGEMTIETFLEAALKISPDAGSLVRLLNIQTQGFGNIHNHKDHAAFGKHVSRMCGEHHGAFGRWWIQQLANHPASARRAFETATEHWQQLVSKWSTQAGRVSNYFALMEAALTLLHVKLGTSVDEIRSTLEQAFMSWLGDFTTDSTHTHEESSVIKRAQEVLANIGRFPPCNLEKHAQLPASGNWGFYDEGKDLYYVLPKFFGSEIAGNMDPRNAARVLETMDMMVPKWETRDGQQIKRFTYQALQIRRGDPKQSVYVMKLPGEREVI
ncbi:DUF927 domain-containing protein [Escherichia coli]